MYSSGELQRGGAELLVLALLQDRPMYGYEIIRELQQRSEGYFQLEEGLLYPTLHRLERQRLARGEWRTVERRRRRYYVLTDTGHATLSSAAREWETFAEQFLRLIKPRRGDLHVPVE